MCYRCDMTFHPTYKLYALSFIAACATWLAHWYGVYHGGYDLFDGVAALDYIGGGYDIFMHMLGGAAVALLATSIIASFGFRPRLCAIVAGAMAVGLGWEVFEAAYGLAAAPFGTPLYFKDTTKDLIDDFIGAFVAARLVLPVARRTFIED